MFGTIITIAAAALGTTGTVFGVKNTIDNRKAKTEFAGLHTDVNSIKADVCDIRKDISGLQEDTKKAAETLGAMAGANIEITTAMRHMQAMMQQLVQPQPAAPQPVVIQQPAAQPTETQKG